MMKIRVQPIGNKPSFMYVANTHPRKGEIVYYKYKEYKVVEVGHMIMTSDEGTSFESNSLSLVELIVTQNN